MLQPSPAFPRAPAAAVAGWLGAAFNVAAVAVLQDMPHAYKPESLALWLEELRRHPNNALASAVFFTVGLVFLAAFVVGMAWSWRPASGAWWTGAVLFACGALLDAAGCPGVAAVAVQLVKPEHDVVALGLMALSVQLDAMFNLLLGLGLVAMHLPGRQKMFPAWLHWLGLVAGLLSIPVAAQAVSDRAAGFLAVSGPVWLAWVLLASWQLWKGQAARV